jgi:hypothetical protein
LADIEAKSRNKRLIAIGPFRYTQVDGKTQEEKIFLPGGPLAGFAGFMSTLPGEYEVRVARFCAFQMLQSAKIIGADIQPTPINQDPGEFDKKQVFLSHYKSGLEQLAQRIEDLLDDSHLLNLGWFNPLVLGGIKSFISKAIKNLPYHHITQQIEFRIEVESKKFELDARHWQSKDRGPRWLDKANDDGTQSQAFYLIGFATRNWHVDLDAPLSDQWTGYFLKDGKLPVDYDGWSIAPDKDFVTLSMPTDEQLKQAKRLANPIFYSKVALKKASPPDAATTRDFWVLKNEITPYTDLL